MKKILFLILAAILLTPSILNAQHAGMSTGAPYNPASVAITEGTVIIPAIVKAATGNLTAAEMGGATINNYDQADDATLSVAACADGLSFNVILGTTVAKYYRFDPNSTELIYLDGTSCGAGKYVGIASAVAGAAMSCKAFQTGASAYSWYCSVISGAFVCEP